MSINWMAPEEFRAKLAKSVRPVNVALRKAASPEVEPGDEPRTIKFILSDDGVDRDKDTVSSKGWDLTNYKANPVVLWAHDYEQLPIARAVSIGVEGGQLKAVAEFMPADLNPLSDTVYRMLKGGWLKGNSVGFKPKDFDYNSERKGVDFHAQELMEFSIVPIPSHPGALAEAKAAGVDVTPVRKWAVDTLVAVQKAGMGACPECGASVVPGGKTCPKCGAAMKAATIPGPMPRQGMDGPSGGAPEHSRGTGDPLRDVEGCSNGSLCPKMMNQPCPLAEGCPMQKGARAAATKRGRMISAANEAKLRQAHLAISGILNRLSPAEISDVMTQVADDHTPDPTDPMDATKAWPPGSQPQTGTGFADQPPPPQPGVNPPVPPPTPSAQESAKVTTSAGLMVAFLANLAAETATLLEALSPLTGDPDADPTEEDPAKETPSSSGAQASQPPKKPNPFASSGKAAVIERAGRFYVVEDGGYATAAEALATLERSPQATVEEFLLEIEEEVSAEGIDLGDMTVEDVATVIKTVARESAEARDRIRRGRVD